MPFRLPYNGTGYVITPTLGNTLLFNKLKIESDAVNLIAQDNAFIYIYSQAGSTASARELSLIFDSANTPLVNVYVGGGSIQPLGSVASLFGSTIVQGKLTFEVDYNNATVSLALNDVPIPGSPFNITVGTKRNNGLLFRLGGRSISGLSGTVGTSSLFRVGNKLGDTRVYVNDVLTRSYVSDGAGATWEETTNNLNGTLTGFADPVVWESYGAPVVTPIAFTGTIPAQSFTDGQSVSVNFATFFSGTETPFTFANVGTDLAGSGLTLSSAGVLSGTATTSTITNVQVRGIDSASNVADSNTFSVTVTAAASVPAVTLTIGPLKNNTADAGLIADTTVAHITLYDSTTGALVLRFNSPVTNASGLVTLSDETGTLVEDTEYDYNVVLTTGERIMPRGTTV
ncbi:hypothetical protein VT06_04245 [Arsukibacterium sp. MJ3]|uniref:hypothetical protein n=1 Tax=Arsukibacterium sp. MJ3 TaxID=1632859 RepID=UPI0006271D0F|nr:hypothetical protein [Arsukibacterium sp. MJ3]KKO49812.1 hypothetical protein VT06_04245 [Arsukibacterium sp. MJ3]